MSGVDQHLVTTIADAIAGALEGAPAAWLESIGNELLTKSEAGGEHAELLGALANEMMDRANGVG